jgi:hypothetical protein
MVVEGGEEEEEGREVGMPLARACGAKALKTRDIHPPV